MLARSLALMLARLLNARSLAHMLIGSAVCTSVSYARSSFYGHHLAEDREAVELQSAVRPSPPLAAPSRSSLLRSSSCPPKSSRCSSHLRAGPRCSSHLRAARTGSLPFRSVAAVALTVVVALAVVVALVGAVVVAIAGPLAGVALVVVVVVVDDRSSKPQSPRVPGNTRDEMGGQCRAREFGRVPPVACGHGPKLALDEPPSSRY